MADQSNGDSKNRLDRIEEFLEVLVNEHIHFHEEHKNLLRAQVLMHDSLGKMSGALQTLAEAQARTDEKLATLAAAQQHTDERMAALIVTVDDLIRRTPPQ